MKKTLALLLAALLLLASAAALAESAPQMPPAPPSAEADTYTGSVRDYANKSMWFDSTVYHGFYTAYQIVKGNGDDTFDVDAFINSALGEKTLERIVYELVLIGDSNVACDYMVNYWKGRGVIEMPYYMDDADKAYVAYTPEYMLAEGNQQKYPIIFDYHGGGGTMFEATNHGFVEICFDNEFIVVCPSRVSTDFLIADMDAQLAELEAAGLPIDYTRIYVVGQSMGGMASFYMGAKDNRRVAALAANSSARGLYVASTAGDESSMGSWNATEADLANANFAPFFIQIGTCDMKQLPLSLDNVTGLVKWVAANGIDTVPAKNDDNVLGITADKVYTRRMDGTIYTFADYIHANGTVMGRVVAVDGMPHWTSPSYSINAWNFLKQFSRVDGELVISK